MSNQNLIDWSLSLSLPLYSALSLMTKRMGKENKTATVICAMNTESIDLPSGWSVGKCIQFDSQERT